MKRIKSKRKSRSRIFDIWRSKNPYLNLNPNLAPNPVLNLHLALTLIAAATAAT